MRKTLMVLITLSSISSFAATDCTYFAKEGGGAIENSLSQKAIKVVEKSMKQKGFSRVFDIKDAAYKLDFSADWYTGAFNGMEHELCGDAYASAKLTSNSDQRVKGQSRQEGVAGYVCGIAKNAKSASLLKRAMKVIPKCMDL
jgi:hypothetical protein